MTFDKAAASELPELYGIYQQAIEDMHREGVSQWSWGLYPDESMIRQSQQEGSLYVLKDEGAIVGAATVNAYFEPEYDALAFHYGVNPGTFHRVVVKPGQWGKGYGKKLFACMVDKLKELGYDSMRIDTLYTNKRALNLYSRLPAWKVGEVYFGEQGPFIAMEAPLTEACPVLPIAMTPAYRYGAMTPWGGDGLNRVFGKTIPDERTGEALEISCIPKLESTDVQGDTLPQLLARDEKRMAGDWAGQTFPLLLKLLCARDALSVQVHPNDAFAAEHEHKLGKTEAWHILACEPGAELVYGVMPGTTREQLAEASRAGRAVEPLLRRCRVSPGQTYYIPAGCVHAIGGGIILYEIQQSSDVTYRFYDWDRVDKEGHKRELHLEKAVAVTDLACQLEPVPAPTGDGVHALLDNPFFKLEKAMFHGEIKVARCGSFRMLTALKPMTIAWQGGEIAAAAGQSFYLAAACPELWLRAAYGEALLSTPGEKK